MSFICGPRPPETCCCGILRPAWPRSAPRPPRPSWRPTTTSSDADDGGGEVRVLAGQQVVDSSVVSVISRNGPDVGIQLAGLPGRWFVAAAPVQDALLSNGFRPGRRGARHRRFRRDRMHRPRRHGLGGGPRGRRLLRRHRRRHHAAWKSDGRHLRRQIDALPTARRSTARGLRSGLDARSVVELGVTPQITTGVLHNSSGAGQIGAGIAHQPIAPFHCALIALAVTPSMITDRGVPRRAWRLAPRSATGSPAQLPWASRAGSTSPRPPGDGCS